MTDLSTLLAEPQRLAREGEFDAAIEAYTERINEFDWDDEGFLVLPSLHNGRGVMHRMKRDYQSAWDDYFEASIRSLYVLESATCSIQRDTGGDLFDAARDYFSEQTALAEINIADLYRVWKGDFANAHVMLDSALVNAKRESLLEAQARDQRGLVFVGQGLFDCALEAYGGAHHVITRLFLREKENEDVQNRYGQILHHIGAAYMYANDTSKFDEAHKSQLKALEFFEKLQNGAGIANTVSTMGHLALAAGRHEEVIEIGERAWDIVKAMDYPRGIRTVALNLAEGYLQLARPTLAAPYLQVLEEDIAELGENDATIMRAQFERIIDLHQELAIPSNGFSAVVKRFS